MSMSGINVEDKVVEEYEKMKIGKAALYMQMKIVDKKMICIEKVEQNRPDTNEDERKTHYEKFVAQLPPKDCRYIVYDFNYKRPNGERTNLIFTVWCPETASVHSKMLYASSKDAVKKKLSGIGQEFQASEESDITWREVLEKLMSKSN